MKKSDFFSKNIQASINSYNKKHVKFWLAGFFAFVWFLFRSGTNPKRFAYPCQQAAFPLAYAWILALVSLVSGVSFITLLSKTGKKLFLTILAGLVLISASEKNYSLKLLPEDLPVWTSDSPISNLYLLKSFDEKDASLAAGDASVPNDRLSDPAMDSLINIMTSNNFMFYETSGNNGIVGANDIVIIKGNFQWEYTLSTNTDRIKGLIWQILQHPDGFNGEILVADNDMNVRNWDECNNSFDTEQSILDVVNTFKAKGYPVDVAEWDAIMNNTVTEYSDGNMSDGFTYDNSSKVSYPKFITPAGNYVSLKHGIWNNSSSTYSRDDLCIINFAVNKAHAYTGATLAIKNWVGAMSLIEKESRYGGEDKMHVDYFMKEFALPARVMAETYPDLNIIDATWTAPNDNYTNSSGNRVNTKMLVASTDPIACSWYAAKYMLNPIASDNTRTDPDYVESNPESLGLWDFKYSVALENWENYLKNNTSFAVTSDSSKISVFASADVEKIMVSSINLSTAGGVTTITEPAGTLQISAAIEPTNATNKQILWEVNNTSVASINSEGLLTGKSNGSVIVTAKANDGSGITDNITITISNQNTIAVSSISVVSEGNITEITTLNETLQLYANILPSDASNKAVTWSVDNSSIASITQTGLLTAIAYGTVIATARANDGSGVESSIIIEILNQASSVKSPSSEKFDIHYSPENSTVYLKTSNNTEAFDKLNVRVFGLNGKVYISKTIPGNIPIDVSSLGKGIFIVHYIINEDFRLTKKILR
jgi:hypothetical protein